MKLSKQQRQIRQTQTIEEILEIIKENTKSIDKHPGIHYWKLGYKYKFRSDLFDEDYELIEDIKNNFNVGNVGQFEISQGLPVTNIRYVISVLKKAGHICCCIGEYLTLYDDIYIYGVNGDI